MITGGGTSAGALLRALSRVEEQLRLRQSADREATLAQIRTDPVAVMAAAGQPPTRGRPSCCTATPTGC
jgi:hypothetical protein